MQVPDESIVRRLNTTSIDEEPYRDDNPTEHDIIATEDRISN